MDERMLRLLDTLESHLESGARSPAEKEQELYKTRFPHKHDDESAYRFNLRMNAFKRPDQISAEIEIRGVEDFYCEYKEVQRLDFPSGDTYVQTIQEMRLVLRSGQLTEPVIIALLDNEVPLNIIYDAMNESDQTKIFSKPIAIAAANGCIENLKTLAGLYLGGFRWDVHGQHFDTDVMFVALERLTRNDFNEIFSSGVRSQTFGDLVIECKKMIKAGRAGNLIAKGHVLEDELGI